MGTEVYTVVYDDSCLTPLKDTGPITAQTTLASVDVCQAVIAKFGNPEPCGAAVGGTLGALLIGHYPAREVFDAKTYAAAIESVFAEHPKEVGMAAIDKLTRRLKFLPTRADVVEAIDQIAGPRRALVHRARLHLAAREQRAREARQAQERRDSWEGIKRVLGDACTAWESIPVIRRYAGGTPQEFADGWNAATDKEAFVASWGAQS